MLTAITRAVSPSLSRCELTHIPRQIIDIQRAIEQHRAYENCLRELGASVMSLPAQADMPDSMFVEDPVVVVDELAVMTRMGAESRRRESESLATALARFRPLHWLKEPATLEGGDVVHAGKTLYVGLSARTNPEGVKQLAAELEPAGYSVHGVQVHGCLHLKSACSYLGDGRILANREWFDTEAFAGVQIIDVPKDEASAANVLAIANSVMVPGAFPRTAEILDRLGFRVNKLDISELMKAEAAMTCSSILLET